jgi:hypothetical protein
MKITKSKLKQLIKEELTAVLNETVPGREYRKPVRAVRPRPPRPDAKTVTADGESHRGDSAVTTPERRPRRGIAKKRTGYAAGTTSPYKAVGGPGEGTPEIAVATSAAGNRMATGTAVEAGETGEAIAVTDIVPQPPQKPAVKPAAAEPATEPAPAIVQTWAQARRVARDAGEKYFKWTNPKTGKAGKWGTRGMVGNKKESNAQWARALARAKARVKRTKDPKAMARSAADARFGDELDDITKE